FLLCSRLQLPRRSPLFPYTTLFRSQQGTHALRLHPDRQLQVVARHALEVVGAILVRGSIDRTADGLERFEVLAVVVFRTLEHQVDRKSTRLNSSHVKISYAVFCLKK